MYLYDSFQTTHSQSKNEISLISYKTHIIQSLHDFLYFS